MDAFKRHLPDGPLPALRLQRRPDAPPALAGNLVEGDRGVDDQRRLGRDTLEQVRQVSRSVAPMETDRAVLQFGCGIHQLSVAFHMLGPDQRTQPDQFVRVGEVDRVHVDSVPARDRDLRWRRRHCAGSPQVGFQYDPRPVPSPAQDLASGSQIPAGVAVEVQVQTGAGADIDQRQRRSGLAVDQAEHWQQAGAAPHDLGLGAAVGDQLCDPLAVFEAEGPESREGRLSGRLRVREDRVVRGQRVLDSLQQQVLHRPEQHVRRRLTLLPARRQGQQLVVSRHARG
ncbi:MAG: hypothetical protein OXH70_14870 [Acidobacteria bacterium]|nr:hypothetical protein [Acidobacteriota bacterium]